MSKKWSGRRVTNARRIVIARDRGICWLCGHPGADTIDHIQPKSTHPELTWDPNNMAAAHRHRAGHKHGCQTTGCQCIGNVERKATPPTQPPSRSW